MSSSTGLQLVWNGKDKIINHHNEIPFKILKEIKNKSLHVDNKNSTDNIIIRGDNLEGLKALKPYFYKSVKVIYIDPPYNTGQKQGSRGWIYSDKVDNPIMTKWLNKVVGGEYEDYSRHTKWLCMMYPRLKLLHQLLKEDGVIFVSIDDNELYHLKIIMDEIWGGNNYLGTLIWKTTTDNNPSQIATEHEYILVYAKDKLSQKKWYSKSLNAQKLQHKYKELREELGTNNYQIQIELRKFIKENKKELKNVAHYNRVDNKGVYSSQNPANPHPGGYVYNVIHPKTKKICKLPTKGFRWPEKTFKKMLEDSDIEFGSDHNTIPKPKKRLEIARDFLRSVYYEDNRASTNELKNILGSDTFEYPKSANLIKYLLRFTTDKNDIILDSFAGSGTTGQSVLDLNQEDGGRRRFILIQLDEGSEIEKINVCDKITVKRIKNVMKGYNYKDNEINVKALGGGFKYYEINGTLKDEKGFINSLLSKEDIAKFIFFNETKESITKLKKFDKNYKIGEKNNVMFYYIHNKNILFDNIFLEKIEYEKLKKNNRFIVVYAYGTTLDDKYLDENKENLRFMHIPNDLERISEI
jgi:adenine-specific DNA-methyltransferase